MSDFSGRTPKKLDVVIKNNAFFPDINLGEFQEEYRIDSHNREKTIREHTLLAIVEVNRVLKPKVSEWLKLEYDSLQDVPSGELDGEHELVLLYKTAVFCSARAKLMSVYPSMNRRDRQAKDSEESEESIESFQDKSDQAIQLILGDSGRSSMRGSLL